ALARDGERVRCAVALDAPSARAAWPTLEIHSHLDEADLPIRIEHNHPDRRAGWFLERPWVDGAARATVNWILAARTMLHDWGIHHRLAAARTGRIQLMGFESNNPLHLDSPPHWHLIHYLPGADGTITHDAPGSQVPHFYLDERGRIVANAEYIMAMPERCRRLGPGEAMRFAQRDGAPLFSLVISAGGGLRVLGAHGQPLYELIGAESDGDARNAVSIRRGSESAPFAVVRAIDDTSQGELRLQVARADGHSSDECWRYDPLIGRAAKV
nr:hypothetical protein [Planctomycetota bacterium]